MIDTEYSEYWQNKHFFIYPILHWKFIKTIELEIRSEHNSHNLSSTSKEERERKKENNDRKYWAVKTGKNSQKPKKNEENTFNFGDKFLWFLLELSWHQWLKFTLHSLKCRCFIQLHKKELTHHRQRYGCSWFASLDFRFVDTFKGREIRSYFFHITSNFRMVVDDFLDFIYAQCVGCLQCLQFCCIFWPIYSIRSENWNSRKKFMLKTLE